MNVNLNQKLHFLICRLVLTAFIVMGISVPALGESELYFVHSNHLGAPVAMTDQNQAVVWRASYQPFGEADVDEDPDGDGDTVELNLRFPGQYFDQETGTHYNYYRDYDPTTGRYIQSDPIGILRDYNDPRLQVAISMGILEETGFAGESLNHLYGYAGQNPLYWIDPYGLAQKPNIGSGVESHNGGKEHVHWGNNANPRENAVNKDGSVRHGKEPPKSIKKKINTKFGWNIRGPLIVLPFDPGPLVLPADPWKDIPPDC